MMISKIQPTQVFRANLKTTAPKREYDNYDKTYVDSYPDGTYKRYYESGKLMEEKYPNGDLAVFYQDGSLYAQVKDGVESRYLKA